MKAVLQTPTPNVKSTTDFYSTIGFTQLSKSPLLVSDNKVVIEINENRFARAGVKLFDISWNLIIEQLKDICIIHKIKNGYMLSTPSNTWIYLIESEESPQYDLSKLKPSILGSNAGLSLETPNIELSMQIWKTVGFSNQQGSLDQGWIALANSEGFTISLMQPNTCPHLFFNPSLTYFNGKENLSIIEKIRSLNIPITEEITHFNKEGTVDNIIIRDPGGLGFFLFSD